MLKKPTKLIEFIENYKDKPVMVVGDMIADIYLEGKISRISREAPVLVLEYDQEKTVLGGAANVVNNAASLGAKTYAVGIIGDDNAGFEMKRLFKEKNILIDGLATDSFRSTITKTRIMAGGQATVRQQIVRIDRESDFKVAANTEKKLTDYIKKEIGNMTAVILSDYGNGTITEGVRRTVIDACCEKKIPCLVDSRYNIMAFKGVTVIKQNEAEAAKAVGCIDLDEEGLLNAGRAILEKLEAKTALITRGAEGMSLFEDNGTVTHIPVNNLSEVYDVSGAGDTVVAVMALTLATGASATEAAELANIAAGEVVRKFGTATTDVWELKQAVKRYCADYF